MGDVDHVVLESDEDHEQESPQVSHPDQVEEEAGL